MSRAGIGANQAVVLAVLVVATTPSMREDTLARVAFPTGDLTQGRRVLSSLAVRGLIDTATPGPLPSHSPIRRWEVTAAGREAFLAYYRRQLAILEGVKR